MTKEELEKLREEAFWRGDRDEVRRINELLNIKPKPVNEDAIYNHGFLPEYTITAADPNRPTAPKNVLKTLAYSPIALGKELPHIANEGYTWAKNNPGEAAETALDFTPLVGDVKGLTYDVYQGAKQGGWQGGALTAGLGLLGLIPGLGDVASKGIKTSIKEAVKTPYKHLKNSRLAEDWKNSKKDYTNRQIVDLSNNLSETEDLLNLIPERSFSDRLAYMALAPRSAKDAVNTFVRLESTPKMKSLRNKEKKLARKRDKIYNGVTSDWISKDFPITLSNYFLPDLSSNLGGLQYNLKLDPSKQNYELAIKPFTLGLLMEPKRAQRVPLAFNNSPLKNYTSQIQNELEDFGYVGGSTRLLDHYNLPDVPGDLEIITTEDRLNELLKKFPDLTNGHYKQNTDQLKTFGFNSSKGINNEIDADVILQDAQGKAKGRMAHQIWSATQPEEYRKWLHSSLASDPHISLDNTSLPLSAEEIYQLGKKNPEKVVLYDLIKARGKGTGVYKKNQRNWDLMHPEHLPAVREATENIIKTYMPNYKSFKDQFPNFDYSNIEANKRLIDRLGYDQKIAENPQLMEDLMEILNANALKGRQIDSSKLLNGATTEDALKSVWAPQGGWVSGAGGNTTATYPGANGFGNYSGIIQNDRSKDIIKNSDDYIQAFDRELYETKKGLTDTPLPEGLIKDLENLGINAKTISQLNSQLHIDPKSDLGKKVYPLLNSHGIRNINSTSKYSTLGDGSFYSGNLDTEALVSTYGSQNIPYIELPHSHGMYEDAYIKPGYAHLADKERNLFNEKRRLIYNSYNSVMNKRGRILKEMDQERNKVGYKNPWDIYDFEHHKHNVISKANCYGYSAGVVGGMGLTGYALYQKDNPQQQQFDDRLAWLTKDLEDPYQPVEPSTFLSPGVRVTNRSNYLKRHPEVIDEWNSFPTDAYNMHVDSVQAQEHPDMEWSFLNNKLERDSKMAIDSVKSDILKHGEFGREYYKRSPSKMDYLVSKDDQGDNTVLARPASVGPNHDFKGKSFKFKLNNFNPKEFSTLDLPTPGFFDNNNEFYKPLRQNYIKEHPELKLNPKNY